MGQKGSKKFEGVWNDVAVPRESMSIVEGAPPHLNWPQALELNKDLLNQEETLAASLLVSMDQAHLFENWDLPGINDDKKHNFFKQVHELSSTYLPGQGGLIAYINNARTLLEKSKNGVNPLEGWIPEVPTGTSLEPFTPEYDRFEQLGLEEVGKCGFVLVAGGLGERLGYNVSRYLSRRRHLLIRRTLSFTVNRSSLFSNATDAMLRVVKRRSITLMLPLMAIKKRR
jgi:hypothetical protein